MRALKVAAIALGAIVTLLIVLLVAVRLFVNPNDFKGRIARVVRDSTGRELLLPGDIRLSVFPWVALELGPASLGNPPGFGSQPFLAVKRVELRVKLLPLLHRELRIGRVTVDGLDLRLLKNARGTGNWQGLGGEAQPAPPAAGGPAAAAALKDLAGISVRDSRISFQGSVAEHVNLEVGHVAAGVITPVHLQVRLRGSAAAPPLDLDARFELAPDFAAGRYQLSGLTLAAARAAQGASPALNLKLSAPEVTADLKEQTLQAGGFGAELGGARVSGSLQGTKILSAPSLSGSVKLECSPRELLSALGIPPPKTRDPMALSHLTASGQFAYGGKAATLSGLLVQLDDTSLRGRVGITDLDSGALGFDLAIDHIDLDRYRAPAEPAARAAPAAGGSESESVPQAFRRLRLDGKLTAGQLTVAGVKLAQLAMAIVARDGVVNVAPATARLYGGDFNGDLTLDARARVPVLRVSQTLSGVDVASLLHDLTGKPGRISGRGRVAANLTARGAAADSILRSLSGHVAADLDNGAVEGVDLWFEINRAVALLQKQSLPSGGSSGRTRFDTFKATADLTNGVATTRDLSIISQNLRIAGQGTFDLVSEALDFKVRAMILRQATAGAVTVTSANLLADIPATITGTLTSPKVRPDLAGMAKARVQQELGKHRDELKQKLQNQLLNILK